MYTQPLRRNEVRQIGSFNAARRPLLEWLAGIELDMPSTTLDSVYGDTAYFSIPCIKLDLNPKKE